MSNHDFYKLRVRSVKRPILNAKSVQFDVPPHLADTFHWTAGQHITVRFWLNGAEMRRSYTISESPLAGEPLRITVKRVRGGLVSNHINDKIEAGDVVEVMPPYGRFTCQPEAILHRTHYFFGAGSGITPLFAMLKSVRLAEPYSYIYLAYGNANEESVIFADELAALARESGGRMVVRHIFSHQGWGNSLPAWRTGIVDKTAVEAFINDHPPIAQDAQYYICGPYDMNSVVRQALRGLDVPNSRIHSESFGGEVDADEAVAGVAAQATVTLAGETHTVALAADQTVLQGLFTAEINPPYSCQSGVCGACRATLTNGAVHMRARMALDDAEIAAGAILTCQSVAQTDALALTFD